MANGFPKLRERLAESLLTVKDTMATNAPPGRPVGAHREETRRRIIATTMRRVAEVGYARATIRDIAGEAGMTSANLYHYFPNKSELVKAAFAELADVVLPRLTDATKTGATAVDRLIAVLDAGDEVMRNYPYAVAFERAIRVEGALEPHIGEATDSAFGLLRELFVEVLNDSERDGSLGPGLDVQSAANAMYVLLRGLNDHVATATAEEYHATVDALKKLIGGTFFDYQKIKSSGRTRTRRERRPTRHPRKNQD